MRTYDPQIGLHLSEIAGVPQDVPPTPVARIDDQ